MRAIFGADQQGVIALWRSDTKATIWAKPGDDKAVDKFATAAAAGPYDAYYSVCLMGKPAAGRGSVADVSSVPGVWADIDYASKPNEGKPNAKKNYPPADVVDQVIAAMPAPPTLRVVTGGGVHVYWLFDKPFPIASDDDRARAGELVKAWQGMLKTKLLKLGGYGLDSTFDLARVLRIPGTPHTKHPGKLVAVEPPVKAGELARYTFEAIEGYVQTGSLLQPVPTPGAPKKAKPATPAPAAPVVATYATATSEPPAVKLSNLMAASPEFCKLFQGKESKASPSEYDMALANYAINAGWSDQEAAALLVAFAREKFPDHVEKLLRVTNGVQDYLKLTVGKAHDKRVVDASAAKNDQAIDQLAVEVRAADREGRDVSRAIVLENVSSFLGVQVVGFRQTGRREELYSLLIKQHDKVLEVIIGNAGAIHSSPQRLCERLMAEAGRFVPVSGKLKKEWGAIVSGLIAIRDFHDVQEAELSDRVRSIIEEHLSRHSGGYHVEDDTGRIKAAMNARPFIADGKLYVMGSALKRLASEIDRGIAGADLYVGLKQSGFVQVTIQIPSRKTSRSYWANSADGFCIADAPDKTPVREADLRSRNSTRATPQAI